MSELVNGSLPAPGAQPGYRQAWPWLLALVPIATVLASGVTLWLALSSKDGLVAEDYYKQGLTINRRIEREQAATQLGLSAQLHFSAADKRVTVTLPAGTPRPTTLLLRVAHPTRSGLDQSARLALVSPDVYAGSLDLAQAPRWHVSIDDPDRVWRVSGIWPAGADEVRLGGGSEQRD